MPNWARFEETGQYLITCKRTLNISRHTPNRWDWTEKTIDVDVEVSTRIKITLPDKKKMGEVIATLGNAMLGDDFDSSEKAARALAKSKHPEAISLLLSMWKDKAYGVRITVLHALGRMDSAESLSMLREMTYDENELVSREAERYLKIRTAKSQDP